MILVDTSVWVDHLRRGDVLLANLLERSKVLVHVDAHLLTSVALTGGASLWTRDKRLLATAETLGCAFEDSTGH